MLTRGLAEACVFMHVCFWMLEDRWGSWVAWMCGTWMCVCATQVRVGVARESTVAECMGMDCVCVLLT